jgi:peptidyl-prolyl cis-trans isomerase C
LTSIAPSKNTSDRVSAPRWATLKRWLREPLLHFLLAGAVLFGAYGILHPELAASTNPQQIVLTKDDLRQLAINWLAQGRPLPTPDQIRSLAEDKVTEEILSREAIALGLDRDDEIIKRRLAQKMDFLAADLAALQEPTTAELKTWFAHNSDRFALPPRVSFRHLYFSIDKRGKDAPEAAQTAIKQIIGKPADSPVVAAVADQFMFQDFYGDRSPDQVAKEFGPQFATALFKLPTVSWQGPIESGYGWHLVWIYSLEPGRVPAFEEVAPDVKSQRMDERYREIKQRALDEMRSRYAIIVPTLDAADLKDLQVPQDSASSAALFAQ